MNTPTADRFRTIVKGIEDCGIKVVRLKMTLTERRALSEEGTKIVVIPDFAWGAVGPAVFSKAEYTFMGIPIQVVN